MMAPFSNLPHLYQELTHSDWVAVDPRRVDEALAETLHAQGALWNTFIMVATADRLWTIATEALPEHAFRIASAVGTGNARMAARLAEAYVDLPAANFSRAVLQTAAGLAVMPLRNAGWSDWGTPGRVFESLKGSADHGRLLARMARRRPYAAPAAAGV